MELAFFFTIVSSFLEIFDGGTDIKSVKIYGDSCNHCTDVAENSPENWLSINGKYYYQSVMSPRTKYTYKEAKFQCAKSGGKLAEPDETDNEELKSFQVFTKLWIGVKDYENGSLIYDTQNETVGNWQSKISSRQNLTEKDPNCITINTLSRAWNSFNCDVKQRGYICERLLDSPDPIKLVVVNSNPSNDSNALEAININDFFRLSGQIISESQRNKSYGKPMDENSFELTKNLGIITGQLWIKTFVEEKSNFTNYVITRSLFDHLKCTKTGLNPCPYYVAGVVSLLLPVGLGVIVCITCLILAFKANETAKDFYNAIGLGKKWKSGCRRYLLVILLLIPQLSPFAKLLGWILYHFSNNPNVLRIRFTCFSKEMELKKMTNWDTILNVIMILNIIGEAIPQAVISCLFLSYQGRWKFNFFKDPYPKAIETDILILSISVTFAALFFGIIKSFFASKRLIGKYREIVQSKKTAGVLVISEEKPKQSEMHGAHENQMNSLSEQENMVNESQLVTVENGNELVEIRTMFCEIKALITDLHENKD